jgi:hypothetical protein
VASYIELTSGNTILVEEDAHAVVQTLDREQNVFVKLTRKSKYDEPGTLDGQPVFIRTAQVASVTPAG